MPSPFPGMDPYLEGYLWPDVHKALATKIRQQLTPLIRPRYVARLELRTVHDPDVPLDLGAALKAIYDEAAYDLSIDYTQPPPPPPLPEDDETWISTLLTNH
ncbi:MAG: DUF4058 family protein [Anaerolineales bacterium]